MIFTFTRYTTQRNRNHRSANLGPVFNALSKLKCTVVQRLHAERTKYKERAVLFYIWWSVLLVLCLILTVAIYPNTVLVPPSFCYTSDDINWINGIPFIKPLTGEELLLSYWAVVRAVRSVGWYYYYHTVQIAYYLTLFIVGMIRAVAHFYPNYNGAPFGKNSPTNLTSKRASNEQLSSTTLMTFGVLVVFMLSCLLGCESMVEADCMFRSTTPKLNVFTSSSTTAKASSKRFGQTLLRSTQRAKDATVCMTRSEQLACAADLLNDPETRMRLLGPVPDDETQRGLFVQNRGLYKDDVFQKQQVFKHKSPFGMFGVQRHLPSYQSELYRILAHSMKSPGQVHAVWPMAINRGVSGGGDYIASIDAFENETELLGALKRPWYESFRVHQSKLSGKVCQEWSEFSKFGNVLNRHIVKLTKPGLGPYTTRLDVTILQRPTGDPTQLAVQIQEITSYTRGKTTIYISKGNRVSSVFFIDRKDFTLEKLHEFYKLRQRVGLHKPHIQAAIRTKSQEAVLDTSHWFKAGYNPHPASGIKEIVALKRRDTLLAVILRIV